MSKLIYTAITSLDGYIEDDDGRFDWAEPDAEVHSFANTLQSGIGTHLYGRRMYETMLFWQTALDDHDLPPVEAEYAELWLDCDKVVYSRTLAEVRTPRTSLVREFQAAAIIEMKATATKDIGISGPHLAEHAFTEGLVDDVHMIVFPIIVGGGKPGLPSNVKLNLALIDEHRFGSGVVHLHYRIV